MPKETLSDANRRMVGAFEALSRDLDGIRTGRASTGLIEGLVIDYHGTPMPLSQLAQISAPDARLLVIQPWDRSAIQSIERAILTSDLGMQPNVDGQIIRLVVPMLTEERRQEIVKMVRKRAEEARIAVRNVRRDAQETLRIKEREGAIGQDQARRAQSELQQATDKAVARVNEMIGLKETQIMQV